jgi:NADPH-dependent F420 reductase
MNAIAILGGTGDQGLGLALRFAKAGRPVVIGSRRLERALRAAEEVRAVVPEAQVEGLENADATRKAPIVILSVPFEHAAATVTAVRNALLPGQILVSMGVPLATAVGDRASRTLGLWQGSCAELVASLVPEGVEVVSAFQNVSAHRLQELDQIVECDVVVSGASRPRQAVMELCSLVPGARALDGGPLGNARIVEAITALLIGLNARYKVPEGLGIRFTGLPEHAGPDSTASAKRAQGAEGDRRRGSRAPPGDHR